MSNDLIVENLQEKELEVYNQAKESVLKIVSELSPMIFTEKKGRDGLFNACVDANKTRIQLEKFRKELTKPYTDKAKDIKSIFDPLVAMLSDAIKPKKDLITEYDTKQRQKAEEEAKRLEEERRENERKLQEAEDKRKKDEEDARLKKEEEERKERERIEAEEKKKLEKANELTGIAKKKAEAQAQKEAEENKKRLEEAEAKRKAEEDDARLKREAKEKLQKEEDDRIFKEKEAELKKKTELKGSKKAVIEFQLVDINLVPDEYTERVVNWRRVKFAASDGVKEIPGFTAVEKQGTVLSGRA